MNNKKQSGLSLLVMLIGSACPVAAHDDDHPPVLDQTAIVATAFTCPAPCDIPAMHGHSGNDWNPDPGTRFETNRKISHWKTRFFDLFFGWFNEMQKPNLHLVNGGELPFSLDDIKVEWDGIPVEPKDFMSLQAAPDPAKIKVWIDDFLFLFDIHLLVNEDHSKTPHAVIYIPARLGPYLDPNLDPKLGNTYALLLFHIPDDDRDCRYEKFALLARHCMLLRELAGKWQSKNYTFQGMTNLAHTAYHDLGHHILECLFPPPASPTPDPCPVPYPPEFPPHLTIAPASQPIAPKALTSVEMYKLIMQIKLGMQMHNGIIHGKLE